MYDSFKRFGFLTELLVSFERCNSYTKVIQEKNHNSKENSYLEIYNHGNKTIKSFISKGKINFINYSAKYAFVPDGSVRARKTNDGYRYFAGGDIIEHTTDKDGNDHNSYVLRNCTMEVKEDVDNYGDKIRK